LTRYHLGMYPIYLRVFTFFKKVLLTDDGNQNG
jgi:hypothetical protein